MNDKKIFLFLVLCGVGLRIAWSLSYELHVDELIAGHIILNYNLLQIIEHLRDHAANLPLFYLSHYPLRFFEYIPLEFIRSINIILSIFGLIIYYKALLKVVDRDQGRIGTVLLGFSAPGIIIGSSFRPYGFFLFFSILFFYVLMDILEKKKFSKPLLFISIFGLLTTHYFAFLYVFVVGICFLKKIKLKRIQFTMVMSLLVLLIPWSIDFIKDFLNFRSHQNLPDIIQLINYILYYCFGTLFVLSLILLFLNKSGQYLQHFSKNKVTCFSYDVIMISVFVALIKSIVFSPTFEARYFIYLAPFIYLLISDFLYFKQVHRKPIFIGALLILIISFEVRTFRKSVGEYEVNTYATFLKVKELQKRTPDLNVVFIDYRACPSLYYLSIFRRDQFKCYLPFDYYKFGREYSEDKNYVVIDNYKIHQLQKGNVRNQLNQIKETIEF